MQPKTRHIKKTMKHSVLNIVLLVFVMMMQAATALSASPEKGNEESWNVGKPRALVSDGERLVLNPGLTQCRTLPGAPRAPRALHTRTLLS